jgi:polysaccharide pyruvyl transferase CsaB
MKENHQQRILICGNYGASNLGDEAILAGLIVLVKSTFPGAKILAMSSDLSVTEKSHRVQAIRHFPAGFKSFFKYWLSFSGWKSLNEVRQCNLVLLGGGGLFADENPRAVWIWFVQFCWFWILRKKVVCIAQSVGPLNTKLGRIFTTFVFKRVEAISVRDRQSKVLLENLGINNIEVFADPAYAIGYQNEAALNRQRQVVLTLRPWVNGDHDNFNQIMADFIIWLREKHDLETVFLPFQTDHTDDRERYEQVKKILGRNSAGFKLIIPEDYSQAVEMIGRSEAVIGMRLHSIIFAVLGRTPFLGISYSKKVRDFIETIGLDDFSLDYGKITLEQLKGKFDTLMAKKTEVSMKMEKAKLHYTYEFFRHEQILKNILNK